LAHRHIRATREYLIEHGYGRTAGDIRRARQELMAFAPGTPQQKVTVAADFYSLSECRDLLFHVQEHQHRLPEIAEFISTHDLEFIGFESGAVLVHQYHVRFPQDPARTDLGNWHLFETENPDIFLSIGLHPVSLTPA
jgi:hypothetical protein